MKPQTMTAERLTVALKDGSRLDIDPDEWPGVSSATWSNANLRCESGTYPPLSWRLFAGRHLDGRRLVYAVIDDGEHSKVIMGELLVDSAADDVECVKRVGDWLGLPLFVVESCLQRMTLDCQIAIR